MDHQWNTNQSKIDYKIKTHNSEPVMISQLEEELKGLQLTMYGDW